MQSDDKRVMGRPNEQTIFAEHAGAGAIDPEKTPWIWNSYTDHGDVKCRIPGFDLKV